MGASIWVRHNMGASYYNTHKSRLSPTTAFEARPLSDNNPTANQEKYIPMQHLQKPTRPHSPLYPRFTCALSLSTLSPFACHISWVVLPPPSCGVSRAQRLISLGGGAPGRWDHSRAMHVLVTASAAVEASRLPTRAVAAAVNSLALARGAHATNPPRTRTSAARGLGGGHRV